MMENTKYKELKNKQDKIYITYINKTIKTIGRYNKKPPPQPTIYIFLVWMNDTIVLFSKIVVKLMSAGKGHTTVGKAWMESPWKTVVIPDYQSSEQKDKNVKLRRHHLFI